VTHVPLQTCWFPLIVNYCSVELVSNYEAVISSIGCRALTRQAFALAAFDAPSITPWLQRELLLLCVQHSPEKND
jgi:hypothetical protein